MRPFTTLQQATHPFSLTRQRSHCDTWEILPLVCLSHGCHSLLYVPTCASVFVASVFVGFFSTCQEAMEWYEGDLQEAIDAEDWPKVTVAGCC